MQDEVRCSLHVIDGFDRSAEVLGGVEPAIGQIPRRFDMRVCNLCRNMILVPICRHAEMPILCVRPVGIGLLAWEVSVASRDPVVAIRGISWSVQHCRPAGRLL